MREIVPIPKLKACDVDESLICAGNTRSRTVSEAAEKDEPVLVQGGLAVLRACKR